jgi:hypothetical protein
MTRNMFRPAKKELKSRSLEAMQEIYYDAKYILFNRVLLIGHQEMIFD